jgi:hypothetical protein
MKPVLLSALFFLTAASLPLAAQDADVSLFLKIEGNRPFAVAFDGKGAMYIVTAPDSGNGLLSRVTPGGRVHPVAVLEGSFIGPGIDVDDDGTIYVTVGDKLIAVDQKGGVRTVVDGFTRAFDVKLDHRGNMFVADDVADTVYRIVQGKKEVFYSGGQFGAFVLTGLAFDAAHAFLYIREGDAILKVNPADVRKKGASPDTVVKGMSAFSICLLGKRVFVTAPSAGVFYLDAAASIKLVPAKGLVKTPIGIAAGGKGFDEKSLYAAVVGGIVKITPRK